MSIPRLSLTSKEKRSVLGMCAVIAVLHVVGFAGLLGWLAPQRFSVGSSTPVYTAGVGILAYTFGLRHAFDADHIAAIDNTTRKLIADQHTLSNGTLRPLTVGFWFSLGHSTVVFGLSALLSLGIKSVASQVDDDQSHLHTLTALIGTLVSGSFLLIIGLVNLGSLLGIIGVFRRMRHGHFDESELEAQLDKRGLLNRILRPLTDSIGKPWHIYPVGVLFGLGFDTATEVGLLVLAGGAAAFNLQLYSILLLPILFAAGMSLMDTLDGLLMTGAYGWAFRKPVRKIYYNLTVTGISVTVALSIGTIELAGVLAQKAHVRSGPIAALADISLDSAGYAIVGLFALTWLVAAIIWRFGRIEERWGDALAD